MDVRLTVFFASIFCLIVGGIMNLADKSQKHTEGSILEFLGVIAFVASGIQLLFF